MRIIRRKRTITFETCAFQRWQTQGTGSTFDCPYCGKTFEKDPQLSAADNALARAIANMKLEDDAAASPEPGTNASDPSCDGDCGGAT